MIKPKCNLCDRKKHILIDSQGDSQILKCSNCGLIFRFPLSSREELQKFYDQKIHLESRYFAGLRAKYRRDHPAVKLYCREFNKIARLKKPGKILDVGCAYGVFLDLARQYGWKPFGVEIAQESSSYARKKFNFPVQNSTLEEANFRASSFSLVTMWDLIEHLTDPTATLKEVNRILEKDGMILIMTINIDSLIAKMANLNPRTRNFLYDRQHNYFYSNKTLFKALKKAGFERIQTLDTTSAQINRWQSRKIPYIFQLGVNILDLIARILKMEYRQVVIARK